MRSYIYPIFIFIFFFNSGLAARHIIGGGITYQYLGNDRYAFTLNVYRDCNSFDGADLDDEAWIAVYRCNGGDCSNQSQARPFQRINVPLESMDRIPAPDYPCLIPPNICVERGLYRFELTLPAGSLSYHVSYQRCCRNGTISNLVQPLNTGSTYTVEISPQAQALGNNSPEFNQFPPTVICADAALEFDHSAFDVDGDSLVYEFCAPFTGGGPIVEESLYITCDGARPSPACPPPYQTVTFVSPNYWPENPMAGNPRMEIDRFTGQITGTPNRQGQFVVGVCVSEYRNGVLLSQVFRDFQFNVAPCDPTVFAKVQEDELISDQEFLIRACGDLEVTLINESFEERFIDFFEWEFDIDGEKQRIADWNPTVTFPGVGEYFGQLFLNPGTDCGDTADIYVQLYPDLEADFTFEYDTCLAEPVQFYDGSESGSGFLTVWDWNFGSGGVANQRNPRFAFNDPGNKPVTLTVRDTNQCEESVTKTVPYFPVPTDLVVEPSSFRACEPGSIFFNNLSSPISEEYEIRWRFGDGESSSLVSPTHVYETPGRYSVTLEVTSPVGCTVDTMLVNSVLIEESPEAGFYYLPEAPTFVDREVQFFDDSRRGQSILWDFDGMLQVAQRNPSFAFPDTGRYLITQWVTHINGCLDSLVREVFISPQIHYYLPNAFTPNGDSVNDTYKGVGVTEGIQSFVFQIWNRWGELIFETSDPDEGWNGRLFNSGADAPAGVYVVTVRYTSPRGEPTQLKGFATLVR